VLRGKKVGRVRCVRAPVTKSGRSGHRGAGEELIRWLECCNGCFAERKRTARNQKSREQPKDVGPCPEARYTQQKGQRIRQPKILYIGFNRGNEGYGGGKKGQIKGKKKASTHSDHEERVKKRGKGKPDTTD